MEQCLELRVSAETANKSKIPRPPARLPPSCFWGDQDRISRMALQGPLASACRPQLALRPPVRCRAETDKRRQLYHADPPCIWTASSSSASAASVKRHMLASLSALPVRIVVARRTGPSTATTLTPGGCPPRPPV